MNKLKNIWLLLLVSVGITSCDKEYTEPEFAATDFSVYAQLFYEGRQTWYVFTNELTGVKDLSQGYLSNTFYFMKESVYGDFADVSTNNGWEKATESVRFLRNDGPEGIPSSSDLEDFSPYYDTSVDCINSLTSHTFLYEQPGRYKISVIDIFDRDVIYSIERGEDLVYTNYVEYLHTVNNGDGTYTGQIDFDIYVYDKLTATASTYSSIACDNEVVLTADSDEIDSNLKSKIMTVPVGYKMYLREDGGDTEYTGSTQCLWYVNYVGIDSPDVIPTADVNFSEKVEGKDWNRSVATITFDEPGYFSVNMLQTRSSTGIHVYDDTKSGSFLYVADSNAGDTEVFDFIIHVE